MYTGCMADPYVIGFIFIISAALFWFVDQLRISPIAATIAKSFIVFFALLFVLSLFDIYL